MKMRINALILAGLLWVSFLALTYSHVVDSALNYVLLEILFTVLIFSCLLYVNHFIKNLNESYHSLRVANSDLKTRNATIIEQSIEAKPADENEPLNILPTRIHFNQSLNKAIAHAKRHNKFLAILHISLDGFSDLKAKYSEAGVESALKEISRRFANTLRTDDIMTRLEGEEFIVLLDDIGKPKFASAVAEKLLRAISLPLNLDANSIKITASIGICIFPTDGTSLETLFNNVNSALDTVRSAGGNNYQFYTKATDVEAREYIELGEALKNAIRNNELSLHYQPRHHIKRGCIVGVEALIRWNHPKYGNMDPSIFIPLAEETNLIIPIGEWAMREACKMNKHWQDERYQHFTVGVNLSPRQFYHPDIANIITKVLNETGLSPDYLEIEISESAVMHDIEKTEAILNSIKATGVQISIDHFGVGYTSVSHLKQLPINVLKIDQSFIKGIPHNLNDMAIANSFIALAHNFGMEVVAEGVETAEQVQYLLTQNCDMVQGYYFSYPLPADKIVEQLKQVMEDVLI